MPYVKISGMEGKFYVPEGKPDGSKKRDCSDCFSCQWCSDDRCEVCHSDKTESAGCGCKNKQAAARPKKSFSSGTT